MVQDGRNQWCAQSLSRQIRWDTPEASLAPERHLTRLHPFRNQHKSGSLPAADDRFLLGWASLGHQKSTMNEALFSKVIGRHFIPEWKRSAISIFILGCSVAQMQRTSYYQLLSVKSVLTKNHHLSWFHMIPLYFITVSIVEYYQPLNSICYC